MGIGVRFYIAFTGVFPRLHAGRIWRSGLGLDEHDLGVDGTNVDAGAYHMSILGQKPR